MAINLRDVKHSPTAKEDRLAIIQAAVHRRKKGVKECSPGAAFNALEAMTANKTGLKGALK